jgi:ketosteroid isomerase-like protein
LDIREAAERFARVWEASWARHDADAIVALYAADCVHRSMPFRPVHVGHGELAEYLRQSFTDEPVTDVRFGTPIVDGDHAVVEYLATLTESDGDRPVTLAGCAFVRFRVDGLVAEVRDYWHIADGHREPTGAAFI